MPWSKFLSIMSDPGGASPEDIGRLTTELLEARHLLFEISEHVTPRQLEQIKTFLEAK